MSEQLEVNKQGRIHGTRCAKHVSEKRRYGSMDPTDGPTDSPTDGRTDGHTLLYRCDSASKNWANSKQVRKKWSEKRAMNREKN